MQVVILAGGRGTRLREHAQAIPKPMVTIGGINVIPQFCGIAPGTAAEYQLNAQIPAGVTPGDSVPVVIAFPNSSDTVTIAST